MVLEPMFKECLPYIQEIILRSSQYVDTVETRNEILNSLKEELNNDSFEHIKQLETCIQGTQDIENQAFFTYGLALGLSIMKESSQVLESFSKIA